LYYVLIAVASSNQYGVESKNVVVDGKAAGYVSRDELYASENMLRV